MEKRPELKPGDIFCTAFPGAMLGTVINGVQAWYAKDGESELSHTGRIVTTNGVTFEALGRYKHQKSVWDAYGDPDTKLIIFRHDNMTTEWAFAAHRACLKRYKAKLFKGKPDFTGYKGKFYPAWRLPLFMTPHLAKIGLLKFEVCSEAAMFAWHTAGLVGSFKGWNPDMVADYCVSNPKVDVVYHQNIEMYPPEYLDKGGNR